MRAKAPAFSLRPALPTLQPPFLVVLLGVPTARGFLGKDRALCLRSPPLPFPTAYTQAQIGDSREGNPSSWPWIPSFWEAVSSPVFVSWSLALWVSWTLNPVSLPPKTARLCLHHCLCTASKGHLGYWEQSLDSLLLLPFLFLAVNALCCLLFHMIFSCLST